MRLLFFPLGLICWVLDIRAGLTPTSVLRGVVVAFASSVARRTISIQVWGGGGLAVSSAGGVETGEERVDSVLASAKESRI